jgi:YVTN family beta-propeller protein
MEEIISIKTVLVSAGVFFFMFCANALGQSSPNQPTAMDNHSRGSLLVVSQGNNSVTRVDPESGAKLTVLTTHEVRAHEVAVSPDGRWAYLPIYGNAGVGNPGTSGRSIEVLDLQKGALTSSIDLGRPTRPHCAKFGPDGLLYVTAEMDNAIDVIDPAQAKKVASIDTKQPESHMLAITRDGKRGYTANVGSGTVSVLDMVARKPLAVIPVAETVQRISLSVDDRWVFTSDQKQPRLAVIDTSTQKVANWIALPSTGYGTAPTPDGKWLLVSLPGAGQVAIVDLSAMKVDRTIAVGARPVEILVRTDEPVAYVSCSDDGKVAVLDLKQWKVAKMLDIAPGADGLGWVAQ